MKTIGQCPLLARRFTVLKWVEDACVCVLVYSTGIVRNELTSVDMPS